MTSLALGSKLSSINARTRVAKAVANFLTGLPQKLVRTTRAGLATCIGPDGTLQWGPHNLISESDSLITWGTAAPVFTPFAVPAFDGRQIGARFMTQGGTINTSKGEIAVSDNKISLSCDVQRGNFDTGNGAYVYGFYNQSTGLDLAYITVNYATGAVGLTGPQAATSVAYTKDLGNGWFRIGVTVTAGVSPGNLVYAYLGGVGGAAPAGLQWNVARVMVNNGTSMDYVDSTVKNRLGYSNDFTNPVWGKTSLTPIPAATTMPDGTPMAALVEGTATSVHTLFQTISKSATSAAYDGSIYLKAGTRTWAAIQLSDANGYAYVCINLITGALGNNGATLASPLFNVSNVGGGVWRVDASAISAASTGTLYVYMANGDGPTGVTYAGDGVSHIFAANAQLNPGTTLWPYFYNAAAAPAVGAFYAQRTDYDVSTVSGIGPNLVPALTTGLWGTVQAGWSFSGGKANVNSSSGTASILNGSAVVGKAYLVTYVIDSVAGTGIAGTAGGAAIAYRGSPGTYTDLVVATSTAGFGVTAGGTNTVAVVSSIIVQEAFSGKIAGYGPELVVNGDFASGTTGWTGFNGTLANVSGALQLTQTTGGYCLAYVTLSGLTVGKTYAYAVTFVSMASATNSQVWVGSAPASAQDLNRDLASTATGTVTGTFVAGATSRLLEVAFIGASVVASIDNISVKEIIFASKGALIEPTQVTQLLANPDDLSASPWAGCVATDDGTKFRGRVSWKVAKANATTSENRASNVTSTISGNHTVRVVFLASSNSSQCDFGVWGGTSNWGVTGNTSFTIESGPGAVSNMGGSLWRITGLSTNVPLVVAFTRNFTSSETAQLNIFPDTYNSTTIGKAIYVQVDNLEAGTSPTSFIPNPATSGTVVRVADTSSVGYDDLAKALPWLMDTNVITAPEGGIATATTNAGVTDAATSIAGFAASIQFSAGATTQICYRPAVSTNGQIRSFSCVVQMDDNSAPVVSANSGLGDFSIMQNNTGFGATSVAPRGDGSFLVKLEGYTSNGYGSCGIVRYSTQSGKAFRVTAMKDCLGPVAQTYYPQSSKQASIVFEGDLTYGVGSAGVVLASLDTGAATGVEFYKATANNNLIGYVGANNAISGTISSGSPIKSAIGFSPSSAGIALNGVSEVSITASVLPSGIKQLLIGKDYSGSPASSMHIRRLRIFNTNLPASTKQALTR